MKPPQGTLFSRRKRAVFRGRKSLSDGRLLRPRSHEDSSQPVDFDVESPDVLSDNYTEPHDFDFLPAQPQASGPLDFWPAASAARGALLFASCCLILSLFAWNTAQANLFWASGSDIFQHGQWHRLVTALFLHGDASHWASNAWLLVVFGFLLRGYFGRALFPWAALVVGILSNLVTCWWYPPEVRLYGASGMVYGMGALWLALYLRFDAARALPTRLMRASGFALLMFFPQQYERGVSYLAHASGFVIGAIGGILLGVWLMPSKTSPPSEGFLHKRSSPSGDSPRPEEHH
jgi:membrane associated rhomboid family serine protease